MLRSCEMHADWSAVMAWWGWDITPSAMLIWSNSQFIIVMVVDGCVISQWPQSSVSLSRSNVTYSRSIWICGFLRFTAWFCVKQKRINEWKKIPATRSFVELMNKQRISIYSQWPCIIRALITQAKSFSTFIRFCAGCLLCAAASRWAVGWWVVCWLLDLFGVGCRCRHRSSRFCLLSLCMFDVHARLGIFRCCPAISNILRFLFHFPFLYVSIWRALFWATLHRC